MAKRKDGEGSVRQLQGGSWECLMQSKYLNRVNSTVKGFVFWEKFYLRIMF
ncbi:MAG: hypothetical protein HFI29_08585 [Lachnospiraceae bacterium]|jgi:hypothetical protein|nr:hypothetical protein [Lachnospiraceae bacterium]